jgi:hypothetical protein
MLMNMRAGRKRSVAEKSPAVTLIWRGAARTACSQGNLNDLSEHQLPAQAAQASISPQFGASYLHVRIACPVIEGASQAMIAISNAGHPIPIRIGAIGWVKLRNPWQISRSSMPATKICGRVPSLEAIVPAK